MKSFLSLIVINYFNTSVHLTVFTVYTKFSVLTDQKIFCFKAKECRRKCPERDLANLQAY